MLQSIFCKIFCDQNCCENFQDFLISPCKVLHALPNLGMYRGIHMHCMPSYHKDCKYTKATNETSKDLAKFHLPS